MSLNPAQETAVKTCGIQLILAGPGSGKTKVITEKILHLLDQGIPPSQILALFIVGFSDSL
jgi:DNA helicase II / ATP-dependent DNA helicase PcrA